MNTSSPTLSARLLQACRWSSYFLNSSLEPHFAKPAVSFHLINGMVPNDGRSAYIARAVAIKTPPTQLLEERARYAPRGASATVLTYMLGANGDLHSDPDTRPAQILVILQDSSGIIRRRVGIKDNGQTLTVLPDQLTPFDFRFMASELAGRAHKSSQDHGARRASH